MPTTRIGNTSMTGGSAIVTPGQSPNRNNKATRIGDTTVSGNGSVRVTNSPKTNQSLNGSSNNTAQNFSPSGSNPMTQNNNVGVRGAMQQAGFDNYGIGYNNGAVTYNGQNVIIPSNVENGTSYASQDAVNRGMSDYLTNNGYSGIRQTLTDRGIDPSRIGWSNGYVTIDGQNAFKPQYNVNGTTYAGEIDMNDMTRQAYEQAGTPLIGARDYVTSQGYGGLVDWDGSNATIGGVPIDTAYVQNGVAYATQEDIDNAIAEFENRTGMMTPADVTQAYEDRYGGVVDNALNTLLNREEWSYDPESDLAWQTYLDQYTNLGEDAYRRALNDNNTNVFGASGAALSEALAARNDYMQEAAYQLPQLIRDSYDRYTGETDRLRNNLADSRTVGNDYYDRTYQQRQDVYDETYQALQDERDEKSWHDLWADEHRLNEQQIYQGDVYNSRYPEIVDTDLALNRLDYDTGRTELGMTQSTALNEFVPWMAEMLGLVWDSTKNAYVNPLNGETVDPFTGLTSYGYAEAIGPQMAQNAGQMGMMNSLRAMNGANVEQPAGYKQAIAELADQALSQPTATATTGTIVTPGATTPYVPNFGLSQTDVNNLIRTWQP